MESIMTFGDAIEAMKAGQSVSRHGWNGKGMFLYLVPAKAYAPTTDIAKKVWGGEPVPYGAYVAMKCWDGTVIPWTPSTTDMLSEDWTVVHLD